MRKKDTSKLGMPTFLYAHLLALLLIPSAAASQESLNISNPEILAMCEQVAGLGHYVAGLGEAGGDVEQTAVEMSVQILSDSDTGLLPKSVAAKMVASINLGALGVGTPEEIGYFVYNNCINTDWLGDQ